MACRSADGAVLVTLKAGVIVEVPVPHVAPVPYSNWNVVEAVWVEVTCQPQILTVWPVDPVITSVVVAVAGLACAVRLHRIWFVGPATCSARAGEKGRTAVRSSPRRRNFFMTAVLLVQGGYLLGDGAGAPPPGGCGLPPPPGGFHTKIQPVPGA